MGGIEHISELRDLARLAADRAQAVLARQQAERHRILTEISALETPAASAGDTGDLVSAGQVSAKWDNWRAYRRRHLADALAASTTLCNQTRTKAARLEAKVRAVDRIAAHEVAVNLRKLRSRAIRQGLPEL